jgi:hypothetical protein
MSPASERSWPATSSSLPVPSSSSPVPVASSVPDPSVRPTTGISLLIGLLGIWPHHWLLLTMVTQCYCIYLPKTLLCEEVKRYPLKSLGYLICPMSLACCKLC